MDRQTRPKAFPEKVQPDGAFKDRSDFEVSQIFGFNYGSVSDSRYRKACLSVG
jgi:hypothetical protein